MRDFRFWWWVPLPSAVMVFILMAWAQAHGAKIVWPWVGYACALIVIFGWWICWLGSGKR